MDFTPGWYDRAPIDHLEIRLKSFVPVSSVTADPAPTSTEAGEMVWVRTGLTPGEQVKISISFPKSSAPVAIPGTNLRRGEALLHIMPLSPLSSILPSCS